MMEMDDINKTFKDICEVAKLLDLGQLKEAEKDLEANWVDYVCFLDRSAYAIFGKYGFDESKENQIAHALISISVSLDDLYGFLGNMYDICLEDIAKEAKECDFLSALEAFSKMDDFYELAKYVIPTESDLQKELVDIITECDSYEDMYDELYDEMESSYETEDDSENCQWSQGYSIEGLRFYRNNSYSKQNKCR